MGITFKVAGSMAILVLLFGLVSSQSLLTLHNRTKSSYPGCFQPHVETCIRADIDLDLLKTSVTLTLPNAASLTLSHREQNSAVFMGENSEAVFVWRGNHVAGHLNAGGRSWMLEGCGTGCYLWIGQTNNWVDEKSMNSSTVLTGENTDKGLKDEYRFPSWMLEDTITVVTYSVMIWTTAQFRALFSSDTDMDTFIDLIFVETNRGYINSEMPVRVQLHDVKPHPTLEDERTGSQLLYKFEDSMSQGELLNCADSAALLVGDFNYCGIANLDVTSSCRTYSVTAKGCATGYYSFGHEIGHNFGAHHNPEQSSAPSGDKYGHLILPTGAQQQDGYRTIMTYNAFGHRNRVNYYSNPEVIFPTTGTATGVTGVSNNARVITAARFAMSVCGTEEPNGQCNDCNIHPEAEACLTCCDTVQLSSTDANFLSSGYKIFAGTYSLYTSNPSSNDRKVYKLDSANYCLYWSNSTWRIAACTMVGSGTYFIKSSATSKKCPHGGDLVWQYPSNQDSTMKVSCTTACNSSPPTSPSDRVSDWDGSSLTAGSVVTYTCTTGSCIPVAAVCNPQSLQWTPTSLESVLACDSCNSGVTPAPTTTTPPPVTTTTEDSPSTTTTLTSTTTTPAPTTTTPVPVTTTTPAPTTTTPTPVTTTTDDSPAATTTPTYCGSRDQSTSNGRRPELKSAG